MHRKGAEAVVRAGGAAANAVLCTTPCWRKQRGDCTGTGCVASARAGSSCPPAPPHTHRTLYLPLAQLVASFWRAGIWKGR